MFARIDELLNFCYVCDLLNDSKHRSVVATKVEMKFVLFSFPSIGEIGKLFTLSSWEICLKIHPGQPSGGVWRAEGTECWFCFNSRATRDNTTVVVNKTFPPFNWGEHAPCYCHPPTSRLCSIPSTRDRSHITWLTSIRRFISLPSSTLRFPENWFNFEAAFINVDIDRKLPFSAACLSSLALLLFDVTSTCCWWWKSRKWKSDSREKKMRPFRIII